jgi:First C2 domain of RPGR-interacting protein 1
MRKELDEAKHWMQEKRRYQEVKDPLLLKPSLARKVVEIVVQQGFNLAIQGLASNRHNPNIQPFFHYKFYTFDEVISACVHGMNPKFEHRRLFECDDNAEFATYMKKSCLKIDFIDESSELTKEIRDYIGTATIPLNAIYEQKSFSSRV